MLSYTTHSPSNTSALHVVGQSHIVAPHVELPLAQTQHTTQYIARVDSYPHIHVKASGFPYKPTLDVDA